MTKPLYSDPVISEIHDIRQQLLDDCGGDLQEFRRRLRERQPNSGRNVVRGRLPKRTKPNDASERANRAS